VGRLVGIKYIVGLLVGGCDGPLLMTVGLAVFGARVGFANVGVRVVGPGVGRNEGLTVGINVGRLSGSPKAPYINEITNMKVNKKFGMIICIRTQFNFDLFPRLVSNKLL
jgi:hypothetical protein